MSTTADPSKKTAARPELVKMNTAFKLAEKWVSNMTKTTDNESTRVVLEARPPGLGIGAVVPRHQPSVALSNDPVERKLRALTDAGKRKFSKIEEENNSNPRDDGTSDEDEATESRTKAFVKKKAPSLPSSLPANNKHKLERMTWLSVCLIVGQWLVSCGFKELDMANLEADIQLKSTLSHL